MIEKSNLIAFRQYRIFIYMVKTFQKTNALFYSISTLPDLFNHIDTAGNIVLLESRKYSLINSMVLAINRTVLYQNL